MIGRRIPDPEGNGFYNLMEVGEFEYANPIHKMSEVVVSAHMTMERSIFLLKPELVPSSKHIKDPEKIITKVLLKRAFEFWQEEYQQTISLKLPEVLLSILECRKKKEQVKALKGISLTSEELMAFIFTAWEKYGFSYSVYLSSHNPSGIDSKQMPRFAYKKEDDKIISVGDTAFSDRQIRSVIDQRSVIVSKFLDKGDTWHCFFLTYKSMAAKEVGGAPHLHYISSAWGLSRAEVLAQLKTKNYKLPPLPHIEFHTHRNPRKS